MLLLAPPDHLSPLWPRRPLGWTIMPAPRLACPVCLPGNPQGPPLSFLILGEGASQGSCLGYSFPAQCVCVLVRARRALGGEWPDRAARNITRRQEPSSPEAGLCSALSFCCQASSSITVTVSQGLSVASLEVLAWLLTHPPSLGYQILL